MAVTEQDIIDNASGIADLVNGSTTSVTIGDLDKVTSIGSADPVHTQISGVDKYIEKEDFDSDTTDDINSGIPTRQYQIDGDFNRWDEGTSISATGYGAASIWSFDLSGATGTFSQQAHASTNSKPYFARINTTVANNNTAIIQRLEGNVFSGKSLSFFIKAKGTGVTSIDCAVIDSGSASQASGTIISSITTDFAWYRLDLVVPSFSTTNWSGYTIKNTNTETFTLDIDKIRIVETGSLPTGVIPDWIKEDEDQEDQSSKVLQYYERQISRVQFTAFASGRTTSTTAGNFYLKYHRKIDSTITISYGGNILVDAPSGGNNISSISNSYAGSDSALIQPVTTGLTSGEPAVLYASNDNDAYFEIDARY